MVDTNLFKIVVDIGKEVFGGLSNLKKQQYEERVRVANYLDQIANTIDAIIQSYEKGEIPYEPCVSIIEYSEELLNKLEGCVSEEKLLSYVREIFAVRNIWAGAPKSGYTIEQMHDIIPELKTACGRYRALANTLRV